MAGGLPARRRGLLGGARGVCVALAFVVYLSVLAAPASAEFDWTGTAGVCGGELTSPPIGDPLADAAASQWYACWTGYESAGGILDRLDAFSYVAEECCDSETGEPYEHTFTPGEILYDIDGEILNVRDRLYEMWSQDTTYGDQHSEYLARIADGVEPLWQDLGINRPCADILGPLPGDEELPEDCQLEEGEEPEPGSNAWVSASQQLDEIRALLVEIRDQADEGGGSSSGVVSVEGVDAQLVGQRAEDAVNDLNATLWAIAGIAVALLAGHHILRQVLPR